VAQHASGLGRLLENGYLVTFSYKIIGGCEACRSGAKNSDSLARWGWSFEVFFPEVRMFFTYKSFQGSDANRFIHFIPATFGLTEAETNIATYRRQREFFSHHSVRFIELSLGNEPNIPRNLNPDRASVVAGRLFISLLVHERPCWAYLNTGGAETAGRIPKIRTDRTDDRPPFFIKDKINGLYPTDFPTDTDTPGATDTEVGISFK
jgi:hypothetical protein